MLRARLPLASRGGWRSRGARPLWAQPSVPSPCPLSSSSASPGRCARLRCVRRASGDSRRPDGAQLRRGAEAAVLPGGRAGQRRGRRQVWERSPSRRGSEKAGFGPVPRLEATPAASQIPGEAAGAGLEEEAAGDSAISRGLRGRVLSYLGELGLPLRWVRFPGKEKAEPGVRVPGCVQGPGAPGMRPAPRQPRARGGGRDSAARSALALTDTPSCHPAPAPSPAPAPAPPQWATPPQQPPVRWTARVVPLRCPRPGAPGRIRLGSPGPPLES